MFRVTSTNTFHNSFANKDNTPFLRPETVTRGKKGWKMGPLVPPTSGLEVVSSGTQTEALRLTPRDERPGGLGGTGDGAKGVGPTDTPGPQTGPDDGRDRTLGLTEPG